MALTQSLSFSGTMGGRRLEAWSITGDGSDTSFDPLLACVDHAWLQSATGVTADLRTSISAGVITLTQKNGGALESGKVYYLFLLGSS